MIQRLAPFRRVIVVAVIAAVVVGLLVTVSCGTPQGRVLPAPSSTASTVATPTTERPDYSQIALQAYPGQTTTTTPISAGSATISGAVDGPNGLIPGAVVRFERLVGDAVQSVDVLSGADGRYQLANVPGGRYRVRAYFPPLLAMEQSEIFYLADGEEKDLTLRTVEYTGFVVASGVTPAAPFLGQGANLVVRVTQRIVDGDGVGREVGVAGANVSVSTTGWTPVAPNIVVVSDGNGNAVFTFSCDTVTNVTATALVDTGTGPVGYGLEAPPCSPRPTTTTTTVPLDPGATTTSAVAPTTTR